MKKIIALGIIILAVWLMLTYPYVMLNPGQLVKGHHDIKNKCLSCHQPFWGIDQNKCIACHKLSDIGRDTTAVNDSTGKKITLFHQNLKEQECTSCHTDHKGIDAKISHSFDHNLLSESEKANCNNCHNKPTDNIHKQASASCNKCHNTTGWKSGVIFDHSTIEGADKNNCASCHKAPVDAYHGSFKDNCSKCHTTNKWKPSTFDHSAYFQLDEHHNASCNTCHTGNNYKTYTCYGCHEHSQGDIVGEHREHGMSNIGNCVSCHKSGNEHNGGEHSVHGHESGNGEEDD